VIARQPEAVLEIDGRLEKYQTRRFAPSHRLDVAHAHAMLHHDAEAVAELPAPGAVGIVHISAPAVA
jgi:hypothetical protein